MAEIDDIYDDFAPRSSRQPKDKTCLILGIVGAVLLIPIVAIVGSIICCGGFSYWGWDEAMGVLEDAVEVELAANPVAQQHLGDITSVDINLTETGEANKPGYLVFDVVGTKGSGQVSLKQNTGNEARPLSTEDGELRMSNGDVFPLDGEDPPDASGAGLELSEPANVPEGIE